MTDPESLRASLVESIAAAIEAHPAVIRLDPGPLNAIATYVPGRRLGGVYLRECGGPAQIDAEGLTSLRAEVGVVLAVGRPLPGVVTELRVLVIDLVKQLNLTMATTTRTSLRASITAVDVTVAGVQ